MFLIVVYLPSKGSYLLKCAAPLSLRLLSAEQLIGDSQAK